MYVFLVCTDAEKLFEKKYNYTYRNKKTSDKMRSRTEMVTTTFVDSEEDYSDDDDSEEDWRPSASNKNGKKQKQQKGSGGGGTAKKGRKRKGPSVPLNKNSKRKPAYDESEDYEEDEASEDNYECDDYDTGSGPSKKKQSNLPPKKQFSDKSSSHSENSNEVGDILNLLVYVKDLMSADPNFNTRLCLWRKDSNDLLQKYIRVKTAPDQFLFTSSSVYSSFDGKRISDFYDVKVKSLDSAYRRVQILNPSVLHNITKKISKNKKANIETDDLAGETEKSKCKKTKSNLKKMYKSPQDYIEQDDDDDDEDVEEENEEEQEDCTVEGDDDEDIEDDDEIGDD